MTTPQVIDKFDGKYRFLSNFLSCRIEFEGITYPTSEHAFQAAKTLYHDERREIAKALTPGKAKRMGQKVALRYDWHLVKLGVMEQILRIKFSHPNLKKLLISTHPAELIEGNTWHDTFWGVCNGLGENHLGKLLMKIRKECNEVQ